MSTERHSKREGIDMSNDRRRVLAMMAALVVLATALAGCAPVSDAGTPTEPPVVVEENEATGLKTLSLSAKAAERLGIATTPVTDTPGDGLTVPYEAVLYDEHGDTWTYTSPGERVFVRAAITVEEIADGIAFLSDGPPAGTAVVTVGTAELWGVESGVGGGH